MGTLLETEVVFLQLFIPRVKRLAALRFDSAPDLRSTWELATASIAFLVPAVKLIQSADYEIFQRQLPCMQVLMCRYSMRGHLLYLLPLVDIFAKRTETKLIVFQGFDVRRNFDLWFSFIDWVSEFIDCFFYFYYFNVFTIA